MTLPKHVYAVKDRHGRTRFRLVKKGWPSRYLRGTPGTEEFEQSYRECWDKAYVPQPRPSRRRAYKLCEFVGRNWVYFIGDYRGPVKIGTTVNLPARLKKLQTGSAIRLRVLACRAGGIDLEREYHEQFAALRINGEWFQGRAVRTEIARIRKVYGFQPHPPPKFPTSQDVENKA